MPTNTSSTPRAGSPSCPPRRRAACPGSSWAPACLQIGCRPHHAVLHTDLRTTRGIAAEILFPHAGVDHADPRIGKAERLDQIPLRIVRDSDHLARAAHDFREKRLVRRDRLCCMKRRKAKCGEIVDRRSQRDLAGHRAHQVGGVEQVRSACRPAGDGIPRTVEARCKRRPSQAPQAAPRRHVVFQAAGLVEKREAEYSVTPRSRAKVFDQTRRFPCAGPSATARA